MFHLLVYSDDQAAWQDAARRVHQGTVKVLPGPPKASTECSGVVFVGAVQVDAAAIERELNAGRNVLVAAEPCLAPEVLVDLTAVAKKNNVLFAVDNPERWLASRQTVKKQLGGPLGSPELVRIHRWESHASAATTAPLGLPGALVAEIEQAMWLVGRPPETVFALEHKASGAGEVGRFVQVHLGFCPAMALIDYDERLPHTRGEPNDGYRSLSVIGSSGSAQTDDQANAQLAYRGGAPRALTVGEGVVHFAKLIDEFFVRILGKDLRKSSGPQPLPDDIAGWIEVAKVVEAVQNSLATRQSVNLSAAERKVG